MPDRAGTAAGLIGPYHVGLAVRDLDEARATLGPTFGLSFTDPLPGLREPRIWTPDGHVDWSLRRLCHSTGGPMRVELLEGDVGSTWFTDQVAQLHHLAFWVPSVAGAVEALAHDGWSLEITYVDADGKPSEFAYVTRPGHARRELTDVKRRDAYLEMVGWAQHRDQLV